MRGKRAPSAKPTAKLTARVCACLVRLLMCENEYEYYVNRLVLIASSSVVTTFAKGAHHRMQPQNVIPVRKHNVRMHKAAFQMRLHANSRNTHAFEIECSSACPRFEATKNVREQPHRTNQTNTANPKATNKSTQEFPLLGFCIAYTTHIHKYTRTRTRSITSCQMSLAEQKADELRAIMSQSEGSGIDDAMYAFSTKTPSDDTVVEGSWADVLSAFHR